MSQSNPSIATIAPRTSVHVKPNLLVLKAAPDGFPDWLGKLPGVATAPFPSKSVGLLNIVVVLFPTVRTVAPPEVLIDIGESFTVIGLPGARVWDPTIYFVVPDTTEVEIGIPTAVSTGAIVVELPPAPSSVNPVTEASRCGQD